eukprot:scaffold3227_cov188-Ochromonas_danica.AAC.9
MNADLEDKIELYTDEHFNASGAAQRFFAQYGEQEIVKKLNEMNKMQQDIEIVLKQNVKSNYPVFLEATESIKQVGDEMLTLKTLIENTQKLINDARSTHLGESRVMRSNSLLPVIDHRKARDKLERQQTQTSFSSSAAAIAAASTAMAPSSGGRDLPPWLAKAADELAQYIVEQQYEKAVAIVLKVRSYAANLETSGSNRFQQQSYPQLRKVMDMINGRGEHLAQTIQKSLLSLPHSPLWGSVEQVKRLKLLVSLGELSMAAEGFALLQHQEMQRALCSVEGGADVVVYGQALSRAFFQALHTSLLTFSSLFATSGTSPTTYPSREVAQLILRWIDDQLRDYVQLLLHHLQLALGEAGALAVLNLREGSGQNGEVGISSVGQGEETVTEAEARISFRRSSLMRNPLTMSVNSMTPAAPASLSSISSTNLASNGGLSLLAQCLQIAYRHCLLYQADSRLPSITAAFTGSTGRATARGSGGAGESKGSGAEEVLLVGLLFHHALPPFQRLAVRYFKTILEDVSLQVKQDSWMPVKVLSSATVLRWKGQEGSRSGKAMGETCLLSTSYLWLLSTLQHLHDEMQTLLLGPEPNGSDDSPGACYRRSDLVELETALVAHWLRCLLRYVIEIEALELSALNKSQLLTLHSSLFTLQQSLLPSMQLLLKTLYLVDRMQLLPTPVSMVFKTVGLRVNKLLNDAQSTSE